MVEEITTLLDAIAARELEAVEALLAAGADPDVTWDRDAAHDAHRGLLVDLAMWDDELSEEENAASAAEEGMPFPTKPFAFEIPLFRAASSAAIEILEVLLDAGADLHYRDCQGRTALFHAGSLEVAEALIARGLDLDARDMYDWDPLVAAVMDGDLDKVQRFLSAGADPNATHDRGFTPFMSAVGSSERDVALVRALLDAGADPRAVSDLGYNAFHAAIDVNGAEANAEPSVRAIMTLIKELGVDIEAVNVHGHTPLTRARCFGTEVEVAVLLDLGAVDG